MWFTEFDVQKIGRITTGGTITEFALPPGSSTPWRIAPRPDGAMWFTEYFSNKIGRITTSGIIIEFPIPTANSNPYGIAAGPDGALWFTEYLGGKIGRITTDGAITEFPIPTTRSGPFEIAAGPRGGLEELMLEDGYPKPKHAPDRVYLFKKYIKDVGYEGFSMYSELGSHPGTVGNVLFALDTQSLCVVSFAPSAAWELRAFWVGVSLFFLHATVVDVGIALRWQQWLRGAISPLVRRMERYLEEAITRKRRADRLAEGR